MTQKPPQRAGFGLINASLAYFLWGVLPLYWKLLKTVAPLEILAHRIVWSFVFLGLLLTVQHKWKIVWGVIRDRRKFIMMMISTGLVTANWFLYIWAVNSGHIVQAGLGYFINPLVNILLGRLFLNERLTPWQRVAVALACVGIAILTVEQKAFPWISVLLAVTFAFYALARKVSGVESIPGLAVETAVAGVFALAYLVIIPNGHFLHGPLQQDLLFIGAGVATSLPLIFFVHAAQNLTMTVLGFMQYLAPTLQVSIGVLLYHEPMSRALWVAFICIWTALAIISLDLKLKR